MLVGCQIVAVWLRAYASISASVSAVASGPNGSRMYPFHAGAATTRFAALIASRMRKMSKGEFRRPGSTIGSANGFEDASVMEPPGQWSSRKDEDAMHVSVRDERTCGGRHEVGGDSQESTRRRHGLDSRIESAL